MTIEGEKNIEDIQIGDLVKTKEGYSEVLYPTQFISVPNYTIKTKNSVNVNFTCTEDHEILTIPFDKRINGSSNFQYVKTVFPELINYKSTDKTYDLYVRNLKSVNPVWKQAKDIQKTDWGLIPLDLSVDNSITHIRWKNDFKQKFGIGISEEIEINEDFCELIGIWIAEGSINKAHNTISFTIHQKEELLKNRIIELMWNVFQVDNVCITTRQDSKAMTIAYSSSQLAQFFFELFGNAGIWKEKRADSTYHYLTQWDKKLPSILKHIDPQKQLQIIKGWFLGDGYATEGTSTTSRNMKITTVSKQLAQDMLEIFHRNFIVPSVDVEQRNLTKDSKCDCYNLSLYGEYASIFYKIKYNTDNYSQRLEIPLSARRSADIPVVYDGQLYLKGKIETFYNGNTEAETVYCLKMPNGNFTVNDIIVHNCRGYRSEDYPDGIDVDDAQYISSLVPSERGFLWSLKDLIEGDPDKGRKPQAQFINAVKQYPGLLDIMYGIEGMVCRRGIHASGVILFDENIFDEAAIMRAPNGNLTTQWDLHDQESAGSVKYDFLLTAVQDIIIKTIDLLQADEVISPALSLREVYDKYLHPSVLPQNDPRMWDALAEGTVIGCFQFDSAVGRQAAKMIKPHSALEMSDANGLIRLMAEDGQERPLDKYVRYKNNINLWYKEMDNFGLTREEQRVVEPYFKPSYGVPPSQEQLMRMLMDENICNFSLAEANASRKIVGKKQMSKIPALHEKVLETAKSRKLGEYIWKCGVGPQMGYSFSVIHALAYSFIGMQTLYLATNFNPIYWNTAYLIVNSGSLEDEDNDKQESTSYTKMAKAIGQIREAGIKVSLADINKSFFGFLPDVENNQILFGLKGMLNVGDDLVETIINNRPYISPRDFINKVKPKRPAMISLIKGGAFDNMMDRKTCMGWYIWESCNKKKRITLQNMPGLMKYGLVPEDTEERVTARRIYEFNRYLKAITVPANKLKPYYVLDNRAITFLSSIGKEDIICQNGQIFCILKTDWDKFYQSWMDVFRQWIAASPNDILDSLNKKIFLEDWNKYAKGNLSSWEMESLCFYYHEHELINVNKERYGFANFYDLPTEPEVDRVFSKGDKLIRMYKLSKICGTCIAKNKTKSTVTLLTTDGVVDVKFNREFFSMFDKRISARGDDGDKHIVEYSWFDRGSMIVVTGIRMDDMFVCKKYASTPGHRLYKIDDVYDDEIVIRSTRAQGDEEDSD